MDVSRRTVLRIAGSAGAAAAGGLAGGALAGGGAVDWDHVRAMFGLSRDSVHMSAMLITSHPAPVQAAIERHRRDLDADPVEYLEEHGARLTAAAREAAAGYLGLHPSHVALTDSTTMGVGLVYTGLVLRADQEVLSTDEDYYVTHESLRYAAQRTGARHRRIALFEDAASASADALIERIASEVGPRTRLVALTWVQSRTGLKLPVAGIAAALADINAGRDDDDQVLLGLDAVHGFGVEADRFPALSVDFLMAGCHKWLFGPRGTGIAALSSRGLAATRPTIPSFDDNGVFAAWYTDSDVGVGVGNNGRRMSPGGFKAFEHRWALAEAFALHDDIGRTRIAERTHALAGALKDALAGISGVTVHTPRTAELSAGIVAFDVDGLSPQGVVNRLRERRVIASVAPYPRPLVRLTPSVRNSDADIERAAEAVRAVI